MTAPFRAKAPPSGRMRRAPQRHVLGKPRPAARLPKAPPLRPAWRGVRSSPRAAWPAGPGPRPCRSNRQWRARPLHRPARRWRRSARLPPAPRMAPCCSLPCSRTCRCQVTRRPPTAWRSCTDRRHSPAWTGRCPPTSQGRAVAPSRPRWHSAPCTAETGCRTQPWRRCWMARPAAAPRPWSAPWRRFRRCRSSRSTNVRSCRTPWCTG